MRNNLVALSIFCLGLCFVIGSWLISNSLSDEERTQVKQTQHNELLTISEVAQYLGLSNEEVVKLTEIPLGDNSYSSEIPHIKIDQTYYYPKKAIDQWLLAVELTVVR